MPFSFGITPGKEGGPVPSFRRRASVIDGDPVEDPSKEPEHEVEPAQALALADEAEAEAAEAEAVAAAARARARAVRLRRQAQEAEKAEAAKKAVVESAVEAESTEPEASTSHAGAADTDEVDADAAIDEVELDEDDPELPSRDGKRPGRRHLRLPLPTWKAVAVTLMALVTCAAVAASGYMVYLHRQETATQRNAAEYAAAGRQSVVTLMSLDFNKAKEDVQRIIDNSTGQFRQDFESQAANFTKVAQDSKVVTQVEINTSAVKTMTDTTATVLVSATSRITNSAGAKQDPRAWRLSVDLTREGDQIKMSKVEFVP
jgi:Mce-associated membrane protein